MTLIWIALEAMTIMLMAAGVTVYFLWAYLRHYMMLCERECLRGDNYARRIMGLEDRKA